MSRKEHPVWEEELMPYVDGELEAAQVSGIEEHLKECGECAALVADARGLSRQMATWEVENPSERMGERVFASLEPKSKSRQRWGWVINHRNWMYGVTGAVAALALIAVGISLIKPRSTDEMSAAMLAPASTSVYSDKVPIGFDNLKKGQQGQGGQQQGQQGQGEDLRDLFELELAAKQEAAGTPSGPMVIRTARLTMLTKEFDSARTRIQAIVQQAQGYLDQLTVRGETGSGKSLSATLRLPSDRIDSGLTELRRLGKVLEESQNSSDVTSQYVDLQARLNNARNTEQRLLALQRERTDKLPDVVSVEREIARVREEIERMEAQRKDVFNKTQYATIQIELSEEYRAELQPSTPSAATQLRNALIDGYHGALNTLLALALFTLRYGPALLLWSIVLVPVGLLLRRRLQGMISWKS
jgi:hypothetical protein